jgi:hypothetical protein
MSGVRTDIPLSATAAVASGIAAVAALEAAEIVAGNTVIATDIFADVSNMTALACRQQAEQQMYEHPS